jgi:7-cyano-7-deazaguanine synthase
MSCTALVLFSGGQDSATCLAWALSRFDHVETIGFDYRQRHRIELDCRVTVITELKRTFPDWAARLGEDHTIDLRVLGALSETALTREARIDMAAEGLPTTFVPGRNLIFLNFAAVVAYRRGIKHIVGGMCETDQRRFVLHTPLMRIDKAATWAMAHHLGGEELVDLLLDETHTCYCGDVTIATNGVTGAGRVPLACCGPTGTRDSPR